MTLDHAAATRRLADAAIPADVRGVVERLVDGGYMAVLVGGAVRDCLLGVAQGDWDVASSATPKQVQALFRRTVPTGVEHGTVTVLGENNRPIEVTTFRGEGDYQDGRRPTKVEFRQDIEDDLARRDFTVNAFAWDPLAGAFWDLYGGLADLDRRVIRAVGVAADRFAEDGLRAMRAVRFCATLGFTLDGETEAAISGALPVLAKVSRERVRAELFKLLSAPRPSEGLRPMDRTGMWKYVLMESSPEPRAEAIASTDRMVADPVIRLARLLWDHRERPADIEACVESLRPSKDQRVRILATVNPRIERLADASNPVEVRRIVAALGRRHLDDAMEVLELSDSARDHIRRACKGAAVSVDELAIRGGDLIGDGIVDAGPAVGELLRGLLAWVLEDPDRNQSRSLLVHARVLTHRRDGLAE